MKYAIVTGTSQGLGEALAKRLIAPDCHLICISRQTNAALVAEAAAQGATLDYYDFDLNDTEKIEEQMELLFRRFDPAQAESVYLINNAGVLEPIAPAHRSGSSAVTRNINVNLLAPMIATGCFIRLTESWPADKRVLNISSGAGRKPYAGWSSYCSAKAGLDHYSRCVAEEQADVPFGVRIVSAAPGVIDTGMQRQIRATTEEDFKQVGRFIELNEKGQLQTPDTAATKLLRLLNADSFGEHTIVDIRDLP